MIELLLLAVPMAILFAVFVLRSPRKFEAPTVSPISKQALSAFELAPSLWVNAPERALYVALKRTLPPSHDLHGKVRLEDVVRVRRDVEAKARWQLRGRVKSRHLDYLITARDGRPVLAIELDGASHGSRNMSEADRVKTALCAAVGLPLRRIRVGEDFHHIAATIRSELT